MFDASKIVGMPEYRSLVVVPPNLAAAAIAHRGCIKARFDNVAVAAGQRTLTADRQLVVAVVEALAQLRRVDQRGLGDAVEAESHVAQGAVGFSFAARSRAIDIEDAALLLRCVELGPAEMLDDDADGAIVRVLIARAGGCGKWEFTLLVKMAVDGVDISDVTSADEERQRGEEACFVVHVSSLPVLLFCFTRSGAGEGEPGRDKSRWRFVDENVPVDAGVDEGEAVARADGKLG